MQTDLHFLQIFHFSTHKIYFNLLLVTKNCFILVPCSKRSSTTIYSFNLQCMFHRSYSQKSSRYVLDETKWTPLAEWINFLHFFWPNKIWLFELHMLTGLPNQIFFWEKKILIYYPYPLSINICKYTKQMQIDFPILWILIYFKT